MTSDTPGLSEKDRIEMSLERLSQRFGVHGGFLSEPEIRKYCYGNKLVSSFANITREFKDQLNQASAADGTLAGSDPPNKII